MENWMLMCTLKKKFSENNDNSISKDKYSNLEMARVVDIHAVAWDIPRSSSRHEEI